MEVVFFVRSSFPSKFRPILFFFRHLIYAYIYIKIPREIVLEKNAITSEINQSILIPIRDPNEIVL